MIKHFSHFAILCCIFVFGYVAGRFSANRPKKITTLTQTNNVTTQKKEVVTQLDTKKDSNTVKLSSYTEKFFNDKGLLVHEINYGNQLVASKNDSSAQTHTVQSYQVQTSQSNTTTVQEFRSTLFLGLSTPLDNFKNPVNFIVKPEETNLMLEYRPWDSFNFFVESDYKLNVQAGFLIAIN